MNLRFLTGLSMLLAGTGAIAAIPTAHDNRAWSQPQKPFRIYGNTYYVGTQGLSAILITSPDGDILIDGTLPQNAPLIEANIRSLGVRLGDIKLILNSHAHRDHAGAIAALARDTGATVAASEKGARQMKLGGEDPQDPQYGEAPAYPAVTDVRTVADGETLELGALAVQAHYLPGHTPGSTVWNWTSCEARRCLSMVYADSLTLISRDGYRFGDPAHPERVQDFRKGLAMLASLPCDILMAPHPDAVALLERADQTGSRQTQPPLVDSQACKAYAAKGQRNLKERLAEEAKPASPR